MPSILEALENRGLSNMAIYLQGAGNLLLEASLKRLFALKKPKLNQTKPKPRQSVFYFSVTFVVSTCPEYI